MYKIKIFLYTIIYYFKIKVKKHIAKKKLALKGRSEFSIN